MTAEPKITPIKDVNELSYEDFIAMFKNVLEHGDLAAAVVWSYKPFNNIVEIQDSFSNFLDELSLNGNLTSIGLLLKCVMFLCLFVSCSHAQKKMKLVL